MSAIDWQLVKWPLFGGVDKSVAGANLKAPQLQLGYDCFFNLAGEIRKRKGFNTLSSLTVDGDNITTPGSRALAKYRNSMLALSGPSLNGQAAGYEYAPSLDRWVEKGSHYPGTIAQTRISRPPLPDFFISATDLAVIGNYTLHAYVSEQFAWDTDAATMSINVTLRDGDTTLADHRVLQVDTSAGATSRIRVVVSGTSFVVFWTNNAARDLYAWSCDTASASTINTALASPVPVIVASDLHTTAPVAGAFDVVENGVNGILLAYRTSAANEIKVGFVSAVGVLTNTTTFATTGDAQYIGVAVDGTNRQGIVYLNGAASDVFAKLLSWSGSVWSVLATSAAIDTFVADPAINITCDWDSSSVLRIWYTAERTSGPSAATPGMGAGARQDLARHRVFVSTFTTGGTASARVQTSLRRSILASRVFRGDDGLRCYWIIAGVHPTGGTIQPTMFLIQDTTNFPVARAHVDHAFMGALWPLTSVVARGSAKVASMIAVDAIPASGAAFDAVLLVSQQRLAINTTVQDTAWTHTDPAGLRMFGTGDSVVLPAALPIRYDGHSFTELGFMSYVDGKSINLARSNTGAGAMTSSGVYFYRVVPSWRNVLGRREQGSDNGPTVSVTLQASDNTVTLTIPSIPHTLKRGDNVAGAGQIVGDLYFDVYRTEANPGTNVAPFYYVGSVRNSPTGDDVTFVDTAADTDITTLHQLYRVSGEVAHIGLPPATICAESSTRAFVAGVAGEPNAIWPSLEREEGEEWAFSDELKFSVPELGGPIVALAVMQDALIIFKRHAIYRVRGEGPNNTLTTGSFFPAELVASNIGCVSQRSVVAGPPGVMFLSDSGFQMLTLAFGIESIGGPLKGFTGSDQPLESTINGSVVLEFEQQFRFTSSARIWVFDYFHNIWTIYRQSSNAVVGPPVEYGGRFAWITSTLVLQEDDDVLATGTYTFKMSPLRLPEEFRVRSVGVTGTVDTTANMRISLSFDFSGAVDQLIQLDSLGAGPLLSGDRVLGDLQICESVEVSVDDNGTTGGALRLTDIVFEVGVRPRQGGARV